MIFHQVADDRKVRVFSLSPAFLDQFKDKQPNWGPVGYFTYKRTYSRDLPDGTTEEFWQTVQRVVEGVYNIQKIHCRQMGLPWNEQKAQASARDMFQRIWDFKFTPPGRGLWMMGTDLVFERGSAALQNCAFVSSDNIGEDFAAPFCFLMDMSMLGVGVGGDTRGAAKARISTPKVTNDPYVVVDSREGWVDLVRTILNSFVGRGHFPLVIDYSKVRGRGVPIRTFGGIASGPRPLHNLIENLVSLLLPKNVEASFEVDAEPDWSKIRSAKVSLKGHGESYRISSSQIVDIFNFIGKAVVAGGVRRTAEIMFGDPDDQDFITLKQDAAALADRRWASNNSVFGYVGMNYTDVARSMAVNGEPGIFWIDNARAFSRMGYPPDNKDWRVQGTNPCFAGDTLIAVADGRGAVPLKQLAEEGRDVPVYSMRPDGKVEIRMGRNPRMTKVQASLLEIVLDNGTSVRVTPDHEMLLLDGTRCEAKDLQPGDSLPRFLRKAEAFGRGKRYLRVYGDTRNMNKNKVFEHRMIARFHNPDIWIDSYDEQQKSGWVRGGLVVHHKDFNPCNNAPENLVIMTFRDHQNLHAALADTAGEKNGMWGKHHSETTKQKIGEKTRQRCSDPVFLAKLSVAQTIEMRMEASKRFTEQRRLDLLSYYKEQEATTDLETVRDPEGRLYAVRQCESCATEMVLPWRLRQQSYCSRSCHNKNKEFSRKRKAGQKVTFTDQQRQTLHLQVMAFKDLSETLGRVPLKLEWEAKCKTDGVPIRLRTKGTTDNPYVLGGYKHLQEVAHSYNHRVKEVRFLDEQESVYNITVDDNHTVAFCGGFAGGTNPTTREFDGIFSPQCGEQPLESFELCNLVETYPAHHDTYEDFERTLKMAYLYAKAVTLVPTHDQRANSVMMRNRRIGCSMSGIIQAMSKLGRRQFLQWCDRGYQYVQKLDRTYSDWLGVPLSIKTTTVKPSGTVSLLAGATPGIHYPHSEYYIRRVRVQNTSPLVQASLDAGYHVEPDAYADDTSVVSFPVHEKHFVKGKEQATVWEQFANAAALQHHWTDNQVSITVTFKPSEVDDLKACLEMFEDKLKGISVLPLADKDHGYVQAPYESITKEQFEQMAARVKPFSLVAQSHDTDDAYCSGDKCQMPLL